MHETGKTIRGFFPVRKQNSLILSPEIFHVQYIACWRSNLTSKQTLLAGQLLVTGTAPVNLSVNHQKMASFEEATAEFDLPTPSTCKQDASAVIGNWKLFRGTEKTFLFEKFPNVEVKTWAPFDDIYLSETVENSSLKLCSPNAIDNKVQLWSLEPHNIKRVPMHIVWTNICSPHEMGGCPPIICVSKWSWQLHQCFGLSWTGNWNSVTTKVRVRGLLLIVAAGQNDSSNPSSQAICLPYLYKSPS